MRLISRFVLTLLIGLLAAGLLSGFACGQTAVQQFEKKAKAPLTAVPAEPAANPTDTAGLPYLGVDADEVTSTTRGAIILTVRKGGPAELGGLRDGDVITAIGGKPVRNWDEVDAAMKDAKVGDKLMMTVQRSGLQETRTVTLGKKPPPEASAEEPGEAAPADAPASATPPAETLPLTPAAPRRPAATPPGATPLRDPAAIPPAAVVPGDSPASEPPADPFSRPARDPDLGLPEPPAAPAEALPPEPAPPESPLADPRLPPIPSSGRATLGIAVVPLTAETRLQYDVRATARQGAIIHSVKPGSPADLSGLPIGGVIVSIDGQLVRSPDDLAGTVSAGRPGQEIELRYMLEGDRVVTKNVRLAPAAATAIVPSRRPSVADGPLSRRLDEMVGPSSPAIRATRGDTSDAELLVQIRDEMRLLSDKVTSLEERIKALEGTQPAPPPTPE
jgi:hypothetical protein